jgi:hypothetical protein
MAQFHDVETWNKKREADLEAELPQPERRSRVSADAAAAPTPRRHLKKIG